MSSIFDIATFAIAFLLVAPAVAGGAWADLAAAGDVQGMALFAAAFQTAWFVESMWTQTLVLHAFRTEKIPFIQSRATVPLAALTTVGVALVTALPYVPVAADALGLVALPLWYLGVLVVLMLGYLLLVTIAKNVYVRRFGQLL